MHVIFLNRNSEQTFWIHFPSRCERRRFCVIYLRCISCFNITANQLTRSICCIVLIPLGISMTFYDYGVQKLTIVWLQCY